MRIYCLKCDYDSIKYNEYDKSVRLVYNICTNYIKDKRINHIFTNNNFTF